jgi:phosphate-selective porin OprO and OprP
MKFAVLGILMLAVILNPAPQCVAQTRQSPPPVGHAFEETQWAPQHPIQILQTVHEREEYTLPLIAKFDDGVAFATPDDEFELRLRMMQQTDAKLFVPTDQEPARSGLYIPRFRMYFEGRISRSYEYELSLQRSVEGSFDVLDASVTFTPSEELQIQFGRFLVPFSYAWYDHLEQYFMAPERALFPLNFGLSREAGVMVHGELDEGEFQYAVGAFSGQLTGLADTNTTRDVVGYVNWRPFADDRNSGLSHLNIGGSGSFGDQAFPGEMLPLRTSIQSSENDDAANSASSIFLDFEDDVELLGGRNTAAVHLAWYEQQWSLESEVQYARVQMRTPTANPYVQALGYNVGVSYFVTGEEVTGRSIVVPLNPFDPASGKCGTGAIEPYARFSHLTLDDNVFTAGLADPDAWTRTASMIDMGWNWYPNRYVKLYFDWQIALFDSPVLVDAATGEQVNESHTLWARAQVFF